MAKAGEGPLLSGHISRMQIRTCVLCARLCNGTRCPREVGRGVPEPGQRVVLPSGLKLGELEAEIVQHEPRQTCSSSQGDVALSDL